MAGQRQLAALEQLARQFQKTEGRVRKNAFGQTTPAGEEHLARHRHPTGQGQLVGQEQLAGQEQQAAQKQLVGHRVTCETEAIGGTEATARHGQLGQLVKQLPGGKG